MEKIKYLKHRVGICFNHVIELNQKMLILKRFVTPLHLAVREGETEVTKVLLEAGALLSAVDNDVIKHSVKLIQSNIKLFKQ